MSNVYGLNRDASPNLELVKTALDKIKDDQMMKEARVGKATALDPVVFTQAGADNAAVVTSVIGGGGYFEKSIDDLSPAKSVSPSSPSPKTTLIAEFKKNLPIARTFMADQQQNAVSRAVRQQVQSWAASRDQNAFNVWALGFTTQTTIDGVAVFSNAHVNENGDTVDNLETGALADSTLNSTVVSLRNQKNQVGVKVGYEPDFLLVPNVLHKDAMQITKSVLRSGTGNNDLNYYSELYPGMIVKYNQFLDDTSSTAYFVGSAGHGIMRFEREAFFTDLVDWKTDDNDHFKYKMRAREEVDSIEYSGLIGSTGA